MCETCGLLSRHESLDDATNEELSATVLLLPNQDRFCGMLGAANIRRCPL